MKRHYRESDLLEHYYLPGESPEVELHLAGCVECSTAFESLSKGLRAQSSRDSDLLERPETFWKRQEISVMREISKRESRFRPRWSHLAAAAALVVVAGGGYWLRTAQTVPSAPPPSSVVTQTAALDTSATRAGEDALATVQLSSDPWQTESIEDFQSVVDWESWVQKEKNDRGTI